MAVRAVCAGENDRQRVRFAGQGGEGCCHFGQSGADVGGHGGHGPCSPAVVFVACVGLGDREAELAFDPGQDSMAYPVHADLLCFDPWEMLPEAVPQVVVPPGADGSAGCIPEEALACAESAPGLAVCDEVSHQGG